MGLYGSPDLSNDKPIKPKKQFYKRWWFIVLVIIIVIGIIGSGGEEDTPQKVAEEVTQTTSNTEEVVTVDEPTEEFFYMGDVVETNKVRAIITGAERSTGSELNRPTDGHEFILVNMTIENISDEEINVSSMLSFDAYVDDVALNEDLMAQVEAGKTMNGTIAPGKKLVGTLGYEVPKDWEQIEIHFEPDIWDGTVIKWIIENE